MKYKTALIFALISALFCLNFSAFAQDLSVFDLKLNEPFDIPECRYEPVEVKMLGNGGLFSRSKKAKVLRYIDGNPLSGKCFKRVDLSEWLAPNPNNPATKNNPTLKPMINEKVKLFFADNLRPSIADEKDFWIGIQDSKLTEIKFYFKDLKANEIYTVLAKKYGKPISVEDFSIQNGVGGRRDFYRAEWKFAKLKVTFLSLDTNRIGYYPPPNDTGFGYNSTIGSVTIQYGTSDNKPKDNNPL